jgi:hypothetical protein
VNDHFESVWPARGRRGHIIINSSAAVSACGYPRDDSRPEVAFITISKTSHTKRQEIRRSPEIGNVLDVNDV